MFLFILSIIIVLVSIAAIAIGLQTGTRHFIVGGIACVLVAAGTLVSSMVVVVPIRHVGIPITFGTVGQPMSNGFGFKAPWTHVELMDTTIQSLDATGEKATVAKDIDKADVFVHNNVRWSVNDSGASSLYMDYREFDRVSDLLVQPQLRTAVASVMQNYNPLGTDNPSNAVLASKVQEALQAAVGNRVTIHSVSITLLDFSESTKGRINALNTERGNTRIAEQRAQTAAKEAAANAALAKSITHDTLVSKCLDIVAEGKPLPPAFSCMGSADIIVGNK